MVAEKREFCNHFDVYRREDPDLLLVDTREKRWIGARLPSRDARRLVKGAGSYVADRHLPGLLEMALVRSPHASAAVEGVEVAPALESGALWAVDGERLAELSRPFRFRHKKPLRPLEWYGLARDEVHYVGHAVAAVVADSRYHAEDAAEQVRVHYRPRGGVSAPQAALADGAPRVYGHWPDNVLYRDAVRFGDMDAARSEADVVLRRRFTIPRVAPQPMEPRGVLAAFDGRRLEVWTMSQWPHVLRTILAECLGVAENRVAVHSPDVGGSFGLKMHVYPEDLLVPLAAMQLGRPVRWLEDRREHFVSSVHGRGQENQAVLYATREGRLLGVELSVLADVGAGTILQPGIGPATNTVLTMPGPYLLPAYQADVTWVVTNKTPIGAYRGYGVPESAFMMERLMDALAETLAMDPGEVRRRNLLPATSLPTVSAAGLELDTGDYPAVLAKLLERANYPQLLQWQDEARRQGRRVGIGLGCYVKGSVSDPRSSMGAWGSYETCTVRLDLDGSLTLYSALADQGQSHRTMLAQVVADTLGVDPDRVEVEIHGAGAGAYGLGAWGSRGAPMGGAAALVAAERLKERLRATAAAMAKERPERLSWEESGWVSSKGDVYSLQDIADYCYNHSFELEDHLKPPLEASSSIDASVMQSPREGQGRVNKWLTYTSGAHMAVVEVDPETGKASCLRHLSVHDTGTAINPLVIEGQEQGGIAQALGQALLERVVYDAEGQLLTGTFMDYLMPSALDMPDTIESEEVAYPSPRVAGGFKGAGEGSVVGALAAITNAVADAIGARGRLTELPLTPPQVKRLMLNDTID